jgi:hypothetical protein
MEAGKNSRPPRGALAVVAVGLIATVAAAVLSTDKSGGPSVWIEWEARSPIADSPPARIPGGGGMQIRDSGLRASESNIDGELIARSVAVLWIDAGSAVGQARVRCRMRGGGAELGRSPESRSAYPRSTGEYSLTKQEVPGRVAVRLPIQGVEFASLELADAFETFTDLRGTIGSWAPHRVDSHEWQWTLPSGRTSEPVHLGFTAFWRTAREPRVTISCTLENASGAATVRTAGALR